MSSLECEWDGAQRVSVGGRARASLLLRLPSAHVLSSLLTGSELQIVKHGARRAAIRSSAGWVCINMNINIRTTCSEIKAGVDGKSTGNTEM